MLDLQGKVALVTGSSRGIGKAIALSLAENGANLVVNYFRHRQEAENTAKSIRSRGVRCLTVKANVADDEDIKDIFEQVKNEYGRLDVLISNAASGVLKPALELTEKHWQWTMNINARALLPLVQHAMPLMQNGGRIIAVSSLGAVRAIENYAAVGASKAALESLVRHLAVELAPLGINANVVSAGAVDTEALKHFPARESILDNTRQRTPAGRLTTPEDVANVVLLLCSDLASMIHGQTIVVDGGYSILA
ncbi:MAG: enoyl-[acyl-carrier-protein] reductase FabL [Thermodesulfobacteriota bacterium]|nr:enoyl-[acyl-carrier-protein] reductase FabL [Thermodesulfobacteriota bacterium]